jgi:hypothetical protein
MHVALLSDVTADDTDGLPTLEDYTDEYDDIEVSVPFSSVGFSSSLAPGRDLWGHVNVPSPHGLRYCLLVIDHRTHYMWVRFLK